MAEGWPGDRLHGLHKGNLLVWVQDAEQRAPDQLLPRKGRGKVRDWSGTRWPSDRLLPRVAKRGCSQRRLDGKVEPDQQNRAPTVLKTPTSGRGVLCGALGAPREDEGHEYGGLRVLSSAGWKRREYAFRF